MALLVENSPANAGDARDMSSIPGLGSSSGEGNGNPLQSSCLENPMDRGAWQPTVHGVAKTQTRLSARAQAARTLDGSRKEEEAQVNNRRQRLFIAVQNLHLTNSWFSLFPQLTRCEPQSWKHNLRTCPRDAEPNGKGTQWLLCHLQFPDTRAQLLNLTRCPELPLTVLSDLSIVTSWTISHLPAFSANLVTLLALTALHST